MGKVALLVAGGTGGHLFPALALREVLVARGWDVHVATDPRVGGFVAGVPSDRVHVVRSATYEGASPKKLLATLKAMGYTDGYLFNVVLKEAAILAVLGFLPGFLLCLGLYRVAGDATSLPIEMTWERGVAVLVMTVAMCCLSGAMALRKVHSADPADVF